MTVVATTAWLRINGLLLVAAGALFNLQCLGWLLETDVQTLPAPGAGMLVALRIAAIATGLVMIVRPALFARLAPFRSLLTGTAVALLLMAVVGKLGTGLAPPVDYLLPTAPSFSCTATAPFCNRARELGVANMPLYGKASALVDIDMDGHVDLFAASSDHQAKESGAWFYRNDGSGRFRPVPATGLGFLEQDLRAAWGASFADMDNDGDPDVAITSGGYTDEARFSLYENRLRQEGRFVAITEAAGFALLNMQPQRWWGASWADYDSDGLLDLAISRVSGPVLLFRNTGGNQFSDVTRAMGIATANAMQWDGKNPVWLDFDNDGDQDLYFPGIGNHMFYENFAGKVFRNISKEVFADVFTDSPSPDDSAPTLRDAVANIVYKPGMPVVAVAAVADFNQDGYEDMYFGRRIETDIILLNDGAGRFQPARASIGLDDSQSSVTDLSGDFESTIGLGIGDLFDDGWPDIMLGTGDPARAAPDIAFCNQAGVFVRCTDSLIADAAGFYSTRGNGVAFGDINQDGASDIFMTLGGDSATDRRFRIDTREFSALHVRNQAANSKTATVLLEGTKSNRDAIGARLKVLAGATTHYYTVRSMQGFPGAE